MLQPEADLPNKKGASLFGLVKGDLNPVVREVTNGGGVNLAINAVGSRILGTLFESLALGGRQMVFSVVDERERFAV